MTKAIVNKAISDGYVDRSVLQQYVDDRLLRVSKHPVYDLYIYKYTELCVYSKAWDKITMMCRGIVVNGAGKIVSHPFYKFFNYGESNIPLPLMLEQEVFEKMDGSLIVVSFYNGELIVTSSGSFISQQAAWAKEMIESIKNYLDFIEAGWTFMFELIHPDNQIVVNYGELKTLTLLGVTKTDTGNELSYEALCSANFPWPLVNKPEGYSLDRCLAERHRKDFLNKEGWVIRFSNGFRIKIKYDEYCRLHKIATNFTERHIWEAMRDGVEIPLDNLIDELYDWIKETEKQIRDNFNRIEQEAKFIFFQACDKMPADWSKLPQNLNKKHFAKEVSKKTYDQYRSILFAMIDQKSYKYMIWEMVKPKNDKLQKMDK